MKATKARKSYVRPILIGAAIFTLFTLHFTVSQFIALEGNVREDSVSKLIEKEPVIIEPENEAKTTTDSVAAQPETTSAVKIAAKKEVVKEAETVSRKKAPRESRAERLRRVERILTGI